MNTDRLKQPDFDVFFNSLLPKPYTAFRVLFSKVGLVDYWSAIFYKIYWVCIFTFHGYNEHRNYGCYFCFIVLFLNLKVVVKHWDFKSWFFTYPSLSEKGLENYCTTQNLICFCVNKKIRQIRASSACAVCVTHMLCTRTLFIIECSVFATPRMHRHKKMIVFWWSGMLHLWPALAERSEWSWSTR